MYANVFKTTFDEGHNHHSTPLQRMVIASNDTLLCVVETMRVLPVVRGIGLDIPHRERVRWFMEGGRRPIKAVVVVTAPSAA